MKAKYRIIQHPIVSGAYGVEILRWYWPFWVSLVPYSYSEANAEAYARAHAEGFVVKDLGWLP